MYICVCLSNNNRRRRHKFYLAAKRLNQIKILDKKSRNTAIRYVLAFWNNLATRGRWPFVIPRSLTSGVSLHIVVWCHLKARSKQLAAKTSVSNWSGYTENWVTTEFEIKNFELLFIYIYRTCFTWETLVNFRINL